MNLKKEKNQLHPRIYETPKPVSTGLFYFPGNKFISRTAGNTGKYREIWEINVSDYIDSEVGLDSPKPIHLLIVLMVMTN